MERSHLKVLVALPQGAISPGPRYRVLQYLPLLEREGLEFDVLVMQGARATQAAIDSQNTGRVWRLLYYGTVIVRTHVFMARVAATAGSYDRILVYRTGFPAWLLPFLRPIRDRLLFDFDDAISEPEARSDGLLAPLRRWLMRGGFTNALRASGLTITSNEYNARMAREFGAHVAIVPTSVMLSRYEFRDRSGHGTGPVVIGWVGTPSTAPYLRQVEAPLTRAVRRHGGRVVLIGAGRNPFSQLDVDLRPWSESTETAAIREFDIGLMPMPDNAWTRGKAALKALQYGASGAPTVASWTATNEEILATDAGALLCRSDEEWETALDELMTSAARRGEVGRRARARVEDRYSVEGNALRLAELIRSCGRGVG